MSRLLRLRLLALVVSLASIAFFGGLGAGTVNAAPAANTKTFDVVGTANGQQVFTGTFTANSAKADKSASTGIALVGDLTGQLTGQPGNAQGQGRGPQDVNKQNLALPINAAQGTCDVLNLTLGPLDLNLLGLNVHLDVVHLDITANPAQGLLGQLLCSLAGGLPGLPGSIQQVIDLLNQLLGILSA